MAHEKLAKMVLATQQTTPLLARSHGLVLRIANETGCNAVQWQHRRGIRYQQRVQPFCHQSDIPLTEH